MLILSVIVSYSPVIHAANSKCGKLLLELSAKRGPNYNKLLTQLRNGAIRSRNSDQVFHEYLLAIIYVESGFNVHAISSKGAMGLMQLTRVAILDATTHCGMGIPATLNVYDPALNVRLGSCYLDRLLQVTGGDYLRALILYNGGFIQLTKYDRGENIASETANYILKVNRARGMCVDISRIP